MMVKFMMDDGCSSWWIKVMMVYGSSLWLMMDNFYDGSWLKFMMIDKIHDG